jgi:hypothetical protein
VTAGDNAVRGFATKPPEQRKRRRVGRSVDSYSRAFLASTSGARTETAFHAPAESNYRGWCVAAAVPPEAVNCVVAYSCQRFGKARPAGR